MTGPLRTSWCLALGALLLALPACEGALAIDSRSLERAAPPAPPRVDQGGGGVQILGDDGGLPPVAPDAGAPSAPQCVPMCAGRACGADGCGGVCGSCPQGEECVAGACAGAGPQSELCPPRGTPGTSQGSVVPDFDFPLADGGRTSIRELCAHRTVLFYWLAEWCGYCRDWLRRNAMPLQRELESRGFVLVVLVGETNSYGPGTQADARRIRDQYGLSAPVIVGWEDASQFRRAGFTTGPQVKLLMIEGNELARRVGTLDDSTVRSVALR
ncbi:MAG: redoxin family protein [Sandaracinaceae bacterium]|nr:redoxin family protein [Sandaracinaceae bacterium]